MDIFTNQDGVVDNINSSANKLGFNDAIKKQKKVMAWVAKANCRSCHGRGIFGGIDASGKQSQFKCKCLKLREIEQ
jgi:hypothetical protein